MFPDELLNILNFGVRLERCWDLADIESKVFIHYVETAGSETFMKL